MKKRVEYTQVETGSILQTVTECNMKILSDLYGDIELTFMFDIDKLILSTLYYERSKDGVKTVGLTDVRKNTANNLLRQYLALLKDKRYTHLKYRSIDNDTELIKDILSEIRGAVTKQVEPYLYEVLSNLVNTMQQFATGKTGIGPFALNNNNLILTQIYGVSFAESDNSILTAFDKSGLDKIVDDDGNSILSWISAFINSHVDIAKDPYITALNINAATYNLTALLIRTGFGADALYFLNNPIIRDLAEIELQLSGNIVDNPLISKFRRIQNATRDYIKNTFDDSGLNSYFKDKEEGKTKSQRMSFPLIVQIFKSGILKDMVVNKNARIDPNGPLTVSNMSREKIYNIDGVKYSPFELQAQLFLAKEAFDKYANSLNQLVQTTKIDTKKQGNTVQQQKEYAARYLKLLNNEYFDTNSLLRMLNGSFIDFKTRLGTNMLGDILSQVSITATQSFRNTVNSICDYMGDSRPDTKDRVANAVTAYIKQICMNKALEKHGFTSQEWRDTIIGNKTLASRIEGLKRWLMADKSGKYSALVSNGMIINPLLDNLRRVPYIPQFGTEHYDLITLDNTSDDSQDNSNNYIDAWEQLLDFTVTDENGELTPACKAIRKLANDLAIYAFMTSADTRGFTKFFKYVPISWRKSIGYSDEMESAFNDFSNSNVYVIDDTSGRSDGFLIDIDEFFLNFAYDDTIVPYTDRYTRGYDGNVYNRFSGTSKNFDILNLNGEIVSSSEYALIFPTGMDFRRLEDTGEFPLYIKLQRSGTNRNSADRFLLYRCVGTYLKGGNNIQPIYGLVTPKGVSIRVGAQTYQFYSIGREDQYKHIYDKPGKKMTSQQYDRWLSNTMELITKSIPEGYAIKDLTKYPTWLKFILSRFLNPTGVEAKELVTVRSNRNDDGLSLDTYLSQSSSTSTVNNTSSISNKTSDFGVQIDPDLKQNYFTWQQNNPNGIVAYRVNFNEYNTPEEAAAGRIGNPFSETNRSADTVEQFYNWLVTGQNYNEPKATEEYRLAIINKILNSPEGTPILYYKELNRPSHATLIGYLINNKELLQSNNQGVLSTKLLKDKRGNNITIYRGYATKTNTPASNIQETVGNTAVDYDDSLKGAVYFTSSKDEALDYANARTDKTSKHYTGDYAQVCEYNISSNAKVEMYDNMKDYHNNHKDTHPDIVILKHGTLYSDNHEYIVLNPNVLIPATTPQLKHDDVRNALGGSLVADDEIATAVKAAKEGKTLKDVLDTVTSVFTPSEIELLKLVFNKTGKLTVKSVSRFTDPVFFATEIINALKANAQKPFGSTDRFYAIEIWTKHDGRPIQNILRACKEYKVAPMVSFSITSLGDSPLEKGVLKYNDLLDRIEQMIKNGDLDPRTTTIRLDPILVGYTNMDDIKAIVKRCKGMGIKKFVTSLVQSYGYLEGTNSNRKVVSGINDALAKAGLSYDWEKYYGIVTQEDVNKSYNWIRKYTAEHPEINKLDPKRRWSVLISEGFARKHRIVTTGNIGKIQFTPKWEYVDEIGRVLLEINKDPDIELETCSFTVPGLKPSACLDPLIIERLTGVDVTRPDGTYDRDTSRPDCMCYGAHQDMFRMNEVKCASSCAYCYAGQSDSDPFRYYDDDGNLIESDKTKVDNLGASESEIEQARKIKEHCKGKGDKS